MSAIVPPTQLRAAQLGAALESCNVGSPDDPLPSSSLRQTPVSVTLDGPSIIALAISLVLVIHFLGSHPSEILVGLTALFLLVRNDYRNFVNLGPGGTPSTFRGYLRISWLRLWTIRDPFTAPRPDPTRVPGAGILAGRPLPYRPGPRPRVIGIAPQRQLDQAGSHTCYMALRRAMERLGASSPLKFGTERSCLEKHGLALFARHPLQTNCQGEICHVHDSDHSMHMCLHPHDIDEVLKKGWGQRHPLARKGRLLQMPVSQDFVMVYAPRDELELHTTYRIIEAAIWYILAEHVELGPNQG
ncbi:hypothetical protein GQ602_007245 [Ophiocordyceps camponoti-floridani]|uniref:Luciferase domain-containing protein n=1 Tax=Ophiocordyceps camponoti-floridani TaxID=2030778 RepID=A0A8H4Q0X5_9HYPO|nr:hypothetical protein GQ602_007245 [Ophiocordyceps camponoti-floridani]